MTTCQKTTPDDLADNRVVWMTVLEGARRKGDLPLCRRAERELARLGVTVSSPTPDEKEATK